MGNALKKGERYTLAVAGNWKDVQGLPLQQPYTKPFVVGVRDRLSPGYEKWVFNLPHPKTKRPLKINFGESPDYFLLEETIRIVDKNNDPINGSIQVIERKQASIHPDEQWQPGHYRVQPEAILADLAANNLNRVFDRDITVKHLRSNKSLFERNFEIKN